MKTLIISANDLEALEILAVARKSGEFRCIELKKAAGDSSADDGQTPLPWGGRLDPADPALAIDALEPVVFLVEAPAPGFEEALRRSGRIVEIIDHHLYIDHCNRIIDRRCSRSSLEQFVTLLGRGALTPSQRLIAANDRGSWPAMIAAAKTAGDKQSDAAVLNEIGTLRTADLACRIDGGRINDLLDEALAFLDGAEAQDRLRVLGCGRGNPDHPELILIKAPDRFKAVLVDAVYRAHYRAVGKGAQPGEQTARDGRRWRNDTVLSDKPLEMLIVYEDEERQVTQVEYSGPAARQRILDQLICKMVPETRLTLWAGGGDLGCYVGAEAGAATTIELGGFASQLLDAVLGGNRPLARWRTQFLQLLRYDPETIQPQITVATESSFRDAAVGEPVRNYFLDYMRPFFAPRPDDRVDAEDHPDVDGADEPCMRSVSWPEGVIGPWVLAIDPWSLTIHSYRWDDASLPRFRIDWKDGEGKVLWSDERPLSHLCVHFLYGGLVALEWGFQDGWPEYDAVVEASSSLVDQLLNLPVLVRDGKGRKQELFTDGAADRRVFLPQGGDLEEYPTIAFETEHTPGVDCVAELLDFNEAARQCYSSFFTPSGKKTLALLLPSRSKPGEWAAPSDSELLFGEMTQADARRPVKWFAELVKVALGPFGLNVGALQLVFDERARVVTAAACVGDRPTLPAAVAVQERLFARLTTVEAFHPGYFYDREFAQAEIDKARYDRFRTQEEFPDSSQLFAATDHSLAFLGHGWFAANVAIKHVACHYQRLFLIGLLYMSVFHRFSHQLGKLARQRRELDDKSARLAHVIEVAAERGRQANAERKELVRVREDLDRIASQVRRIKARFIAFDNGLWFDDICTQIQGQELFRLITRQLHVEEHHREISGKVQASDALEAEAGRRRDESRVQELTILGTSAATLVAIGTVLPLFTGEHAWPAILVTLLFAAVLALLMPAVVLAMTRDTRAMPAWITTVALVRDFLCKSCGALCSAATSTLRGICRRVRERCKDH